MERARSSMPSVMTETDARTLRERCGRRLLPSRWGRPNDSFLLSSDAPNKDLIFPARAFITYLPIGASTGDRRGQRADPAFLRKRRERANISGSYRGARQCRLNHHARYRRGATTCRAALRRNTEQARTSVPHYLKE